MKYSPQFTYTFTPGSSLLDLSSNTGFTIKGLLAVLDQTSGTVLFAAGSSGLGYSSLSGGNVLTLQAPMTGLNSTDNLIFFYDDGNIATIKSGATAPASTDNPLVVTAHPSSVTYIQGLQSGNTTGTITTATSIVGPLNVNNFNVITVGVYGTYTGVTFVFEFSADNTNWFAAQGSRIDTGQSATGMTAGTNLIISWDLSVGAWNYFRVRATARTSGTANVIMSAQTLPYDPAPSAIAQGIITSGSALPTPLIAPVLIGGGSINGGTNATMATIKAASTVAASTDTALVVAINPSNIPLIQGNVASAATDSGNPIKIGGLAKTTNPTAVTDGQRVNALFDKLGKQIVVGAVRDLKARQHTNIFSLSEVTIVTAIAATFNDLYGLVITNNNSAVTLVTIRDVAAGAAVMIFEIPATDTRGFMVPVDSAIPQATVNTAWTATCSPNGTSVDITALYVKNT